MTELFEENTGTTENEVLLKTAMAAMQFQDVDGNKVAILPDNCQPFDVESIVEKYRYRPRRIHQTITLHDEDSFIAYYLRQQNENSVIFHHDAKFLAVFDFHNRNDGKDIPGWCEHQARFVLSQSPEWKIWMGSNGEKKTQQNFAEFIEDNLVDIVQPEGKSAPSSAEMMEVSRTLEAKKSVDFKSSTRLQDGQVQLLYNEDIKGSSQSGQMQIPENFYIGISPFLNGTRYIVKARLRYRLDGAALRMWYDLYRPQNIFDDAEKDVRNRIAEQTSAPIFTGVP